MKFLEKYVKIRIEYIFQIMKKNLQSIMSYNTKTKQKIDVISLKPL